ncbi:unnamed protein product [Schistosoma margrebowiei]|uniref:SH3 domain-containing protein n=1 Tax=Schistosoma margrebowiei TaxID=48269 RepID=A0AA84Z906_9TREM|nr:unnamed protein product [Schistosoma margrebowiei]
MTEAKKQIDLITEKLDQNSSQIKRFINFVNSHKKPTSEQQENFNTKAVQFLEELNKYADTIKQIKQDKDPENQLPKLESIKNQLLTRISTLTDKLNKLDKKIGTINVGLLSGNENITNHEAKSQDPESEMSNTINKKSTKLNVQDEEEEEEEEGEKEEQANKRNKHRKTKNDSKSIKLKISKGRNVKESKDKTPATTTTTVIAQIHATDNHDEIPNNDDNDDKHNLDPDKILKKVKSSKRIKTSSKKLKTSEDENEVSTKKKKKPGKKLKDKNKNKTNKLNDDGDDHDVDDDGNDDDDDDDNLSSNKKTTLKLQDNQKLTELPEIETDEIKEIELENEETEIEDNINQVQPFQTEKTNMKKEKKEEKNEIIKQISSQNVLQVHNKISEPAESRKCENIDLFYQTIRQWIGDDEDDLSFISGETLKILEKDDDGWWLGENIQGKQGLVPMNFLKKIVMVESEWENLKLDYIKQKNVVNNDNIQAEDSPQTYSEDGDDDEDADELLEEEKKQANAISLQEVNRENTEVKSNEIKKTNTVVNQIPDYTEDSVEYGEETWENDEKEGEGDETSENFDIEEEESEDEDNNVEENSVEIIEEGKVGITQSSKLMHSSKSLTSTPFVDTDKRSFKDDQDFSGWYIKNNEKALEAYQPLPSSVRLSFLSLPGLASYNYQKFLSPKLGNSHLIFTDILLDTDSKKITRRQPRWQKIISIQKITQLSILEESNLSILNCLVRLCLFDGIMPISNICYLPITPTDREKKTWIVTPHNILPRSNFYFSF